MSVFYNIGNRKNYITLTEIFMEKFALKDFYSPPKEFAAMYCWTWTGPISKAETLAQINKMRDFGIKAFYIVPLPQTYLPTRNPTMMDPNYMSAAYLDEYKFAIDTARECGMECWLYDEGGYPSGSACGRVMNEYPEYAKRSLNMRKRFFKSGEAFKLSDENAAAAFMGTKMLTDGFVFEFDSEVEEYYSEIVAWRSPGCAELPDLTRKEATDAFIAFTHEKYKSVLGDAFGSTLTAVFTDECEAPILPFRRELCEIYEKKHGESILPYLPALFDKDKRDEDSLIRVRRWYDLCSQMFCENFLKRCKDWSNANGMKFTGHMNIDDVPLGCMRGKNFHHLRALRCMDIPGIDVIWRQIFPGEPYKLSDPTGRLTDLDHEIRAENRFFPRYASSAAAQVGSRFAMTESFGVYGSGLTYDQMRFILGFQAIRGVTLFNPFGAVYCHHGFCMTGELPAFAEYYASNADLGVFNSYMERLSYVCTIGERISDVALYYPVNDFWGGVKAAELADEFDALGRALEARGIDFDICDDDVIAASDNIDNGIISMGNAKYRKIAIPKSAFIPKKTEELLSRFTRGGGVVCYCADELSSEVKLICGIGKTRTMKRRLENGELICLFNEDVVEREIGVDIDSEKAYLINITEGKIYSLSITESKLCVTVPSGDTVAILLTNEDIECDKLPIAPTDFIELSEFAFRRTNSFIIGEKDLETHDIVEKAKPMSLGCWAERVGIEFSGSGVYETSFKRPQSPAVLDLGDVRYTTEVFINGKSLGVKVMPPYRYALSEELLCDINKLEIRISNTPANQYQFTKSFDKWGKWQLTPFHERQLLFDRDTLDSGLYGPVRLYY